MCPEGASRLPSHLSSSLSSLQEGMHHISVLFGSSGAAPAFFHSTDCGHCPFVSLPLLSLCGRAAWRRRDDGRFWPGYLHLQASLLSVSEEEEIHNAAAALMMVSFFQNSPPVKGITTDTHKRQALRISL